MMPPESKRRGGRPSQERRPHTADRSTARADSIVGQDAELAAGTGDAEDYLALAHGQLVAEVTAILTPEARRHSTTRHLTTALTSRRRP